MIPDLAVLQHLRRLARVTTVALACLCVLTRGAGAETLPLPTGADLARSYSLTQVACPSAGNCTAIGSYTDTSDNAQGLLLDESDGVWTAVEANLTNLTVETGDDRISLSALSCASAGDCAAAGTYFNGDGYPEGVIIDEVNGAWQPAIEAQLPGPGYANLNAVSCPAAGDCTVVGQYDDTSGDEYPLVISESGGTWAPGTAPSISGGAIFPNLDSVSCSSPGNCAAVGDYDDYPDLYSQGLLFTQTNGGTWTQVDVQPALAGTADPDPGGYDAQVELYQIACQGAGTCTAVGSYLGHTSGKTETALLNETNGTWTATDADLSRLTDLAAAPYLSSLSCAAAGDCTAVGRYPDQTGTNRGAVVSESNGNWSPVTEISPTAGLSANSYVQLYSVACASTALCIAAGDEQEAIGTTATGVLLNLSGGVPTTTAVALPSYANDGDTVASVGCSTSGYCAEAAGYTGYDSVYVGQLLNAPTAPPTPSASASGTSASVSWQAPSDDGGVPVTGYTVTATDRTDSSRGGQSVTTGNQSLTATLTNLTPGDSYTFTVSAMSPLGVGIGSTSSAVTIPVPVLASHEVTRGQILATLKKILKPAGKNATIKRIVKNNGFTFKYQALEPGRLVIDWYYITKKLKGHGKHRHKVKVKTLVAKANVKTATAKTYTVKVKLTKAGKRLLRTHKRLRLTSQVSFTPAGGKPIKTTGTFTLH